MTFDQEHNRRTERELAANEFSGLFPLLAVLAVIVAGIVIYQFVKDDTTQTARAPSTIEKIAPPPAAPRMPPETTGSGAVR